jgi:hypothetical protein
LTWNFDELAAAGINLDGPLESLVPQLLGQAARIGEGPVARVIPILIAEARAFPDLARVWHEEVVTKMLVLLTTAISRAQARGEVRAGDPRLYAFSIFGPMLAGLIFRQIFKGADAELPDLRALAAQHASVILEGLRKRSPPSPLG